MKYVSFLFLLMTLATTASAALEIGLPTNVCYEEFCGSQQQQIWKRFRSASGLDYEVSPGLYSGGCYHNSPLLDGNRVHYGGILIGKSNDRLYFDGRFSFFTETNPYIHLSLDNARERFDMLFHPTHELEIKRTFAYISLDDKLVSRRYWFRQDRINQQLVLVGYFGPLHTILCDLRRNT